MKLTYPPQGKIGIQVSDIKIPAIKISEIVKLKQLIYDYKLVIFREQNLDKLQYLQFAKDLGFFYIHSEYNYRHPEFTVSSDLSQELKKSAAEDTDIYWYGDGSYFGEPLPFTTIQIGNLPKSTRAIYYIDMQQVYQNLPKYLKKYIDGKKSLHEVRWRDRSLEGAFERTPLDVFPEIETKFSVTRHPLVIVHPVTGAEILYLNSSSTTRIEGVDCQTSREILRELRAFIERDEHIQPNILREGDILLWENRTLNLMGSKAGNIDSYISHQLGISDGLPFYYSSVKEAIERAREEKRSLYFK